MKPAHTTLNPLLPPLLLAALLSGCGGADVADVRAPMVAVAGTAASMPSLASDLPMVSPLLADDGSVLPSAAQNVPADLGAHTRAGRYASRAQADLLAQSLGADLIRMSLAGSGSEAISLGLTEIGMHIDAKVLPDYTPILIEAADLRTGAAMVDQLAEQGFKNTWLVTR